MATIAGQQAAPSSLRVWALLAEPRARLGIAGFGLVAAVGGGLLVATSGHLVDPLAYGVQIGIALLGAVAAGLVWLRRRPANRVALLLLALALAFALVSLQGASGELLHSVGVFADVAVLYLSYLVVFAFPTGRVAGRAERLVLAGFALYIVTVFLPWFFFSPVVAGGAPLAGCTASCPANGLMIADRPGLADGFGTTGVAWLVIVVASATIACIVYRLATASRPRRRTLLPVYVPALLLTIPLLVFHGFAAGVFGLDPDTRSVAGWFVTVGRTALAFGFLLTMAQASLFAGSALTRLVGELGGQPSASRLRRSVAGALDDPSAELAFRVDGGDGFVDSRGEPVAGVVAADGRATSVVERQGELVGAIWHDPALNTDPELMQAATQAMLLALDNGRLETELRATAAELAASRAAALTAADAARRTVERDLHDGAQQHLIALQIKLEMTKELVAGDTEVAARLTDVGSGIEGVLLELRDLARGVHPPLLRDRGLPAALASVTPRATLVADGIGRYPEEIETAVYFCCLESLQNVGKHAGAGARAEVRLSEQAGALCFEIADDGVGCRLTGTPSRGRGLSNMQERVTALGGTLTVDSTVGGGTRVRGRIPPSFVRTR